MRTKKTDQFCKKTFPGATHELVTCGAEIFRVTYEEGGYTFTEDICTRRHKTLVKKTLTYRTPAGFEELALR